MRGSLRRHRRQLEHAAVFGGFGDIAALQREPHGLKLTRVVERHSRRPAVVAIMKLDRDFRGVFALVDELQARPSDDLPFCSRKTSRIVSATIFGMSVRRERRPVSRWSRRPSILSTFSSRRSTFSSTRSSRVLTAAMSSPLRRVCSRMWRVTSFSPSTSCSSAWNSSLVTSAGIASPLDGAV